MTIGLALLVLSLVLRGASTNRHIRGRLVASAVVAGVYALAAAALEHAGFSPGMQQQVRIAQPLLLAFAIVNGVVALALNPWRADRLPDRFPTIVQDALVIAIFGVAATMLLRDRIFAATAAGAVVVGLALQDTLGNLFAGLAIQIEKPFRVGHWVRIGEVDGLVSEVTWRATKVRTKSDNFVIVPNSKLSDDIIINYSEPTHESRIAIDVGVSYDAAPNVVKAAMIDAIRDEPLIRGARKPEVLIVDFAGSAIIYRIHVWTTDFGIDEYLHDSIRSSVYYAFRRAGIEIPYPIQIEYSRDEVPVSRALTEHARGVLRAASMFRNLSEAEHAALSEVAQLTVYGAGEIIVRQNDAGHSMFVVARGDVVVTLAPDEREVARIAAGGYFGEMSLLTGDPRNATVRAVVDCELVEITVEAFKRFVLANPSVVEDVGLVVAERRAELEQRRAEGTAAAEPPQSLVGRIRKFLGLSR
jgi:small-conductance mechanosensitive channel